MSENEEGVCKYQYIFVHMYYIITYRTLRPYLCSGVFFCADLVLKACFFSCTSLSVGQCISFLSITKDDSCVFLTAIVRVFFGNVILIDLSCFR